MHSQLLIGSFIPSLETAQALVKHLDVQNFQVHRSESEAAFLQWIGQNRHRVDCLVFEPIVALPDLLESLKARDIVLPTLVLAPTVNTSTEALIQAYHKAIVRIPQTALPDVERYIRDAIAQFLKLPDIAAPDASGPSLEDTRHFLLSLQQQRLSEKLQERLGYLGVYYKRNRDNFLRNLPPPDRNRVLDSLRSDYRAIILSYFAPDGNLNQKIDTLVNTAFFADISVSRIVEIHMELMDDFSKQLKLEGRSEEILLDYRLTLIDVVAHLCEMYRRSIPRDM
ncbi:MAG: circadian clock protein KaiA [Leptolyngbyaceae cyanobacterium]